LREREGPDAATLLKTEPGFTMGTLGYMAPEQLAGAEITPAADVFSLGVVLYEMLAGRRPFEGTTATEIAGAIISKPPPPLNRPGVPPALEKVIFRALEKSAGGRYGNAGEMLQALRGLSGEMAATGVPGGAAGRPSWKRVAGAAAAVVILVLIGGAAWMALHGKRERDAERLIATAEGHLRRRAYPEAYGAAVAAASMFPNNERLHNVIANSSEKVVIESDPPGASVHLRRFKGSPEGQDAGTTPLTIPRLAWADYLVTITKEGYAAAVLPMSTAPAFFRGQLMRRHSPHLEVDLHKSGEAPPGMVFVKGGEYRLTGWQRPSDRAVVLDDFFIDRYEVSNAEFEEFVRAGGYRRRDLWRHPFTDGGKRLSFEQAMARFRDATGMAGPRSWSAGQPPRGRENHPVTDITWYEAAAFAAWKGKKLPTVYQWERAARYPVTDPRANFPWGNIGEGVDATERANVLGKGTMPVHSMPFGISVWGAHHMAGNVAEWCRNRRSPGYTTRGGGFGDPVYHFGATGAFPPFYSGSSIGFRSVIEAEDGSDQGAFELSATDVVPEYRPVDDRSFAELRARYDYAGSPLDAKVTEVVETREWRRETISFNSVAGKRTVAYLYLPKGFRAPFQVIHYLPGSDVGSGWRPLASNIEAMVPWVLRDGRAVFSVALEGYLERPWPPGMTPPDSRSNEYPDYVIARTTELRRGLDYLETRPEIDATRIGMCGLSGGSHIGVIVAAVDPRYRSIVLIGSSIRMREATDAPAASRINFAPRIAAPKLMVQGRYDEVASLLTEAEPLFRLMREPKRMVVYDGGHGAPAGVLIPLVQKWLDETLGPVE
ncbi:MAG TPA: SUMF1/EgtB/PvdO family nonheme iron enzyme, partial [Thermoanaerobaculia bacterium]|nr:SUMF1/EgtB/PvdO family nonheme iron enzyme [Thermoanaerobaculia bacterium]